MSQIIYSEPELIIGLNRKVISVNPNDLQIFKEIELPEDLTKCGFDLKTATTTTTNGEQQESAKNNTEIPSIHHVQISPNHQLLAITTSGQKAVLLYQLRMEHAKLVSVRSLARNSSALAFNKDSTLLLVTDKSGDCYAYDCVDLQAPPKLILGHLSIVFDILWSPDENYIITCDRDDKIRVTNYPRTYDIHSYCLGHREFVSAIRLLKQDFIVSVSGDRTMRLWNYSSGEQLASSELEAPGLRLVLRSVDENLYHAAVLLHQPKDGVALYQISDVAGQWEITHIATYSFPDFKAQSICFADQRLYVSGVENDHFTLKLVPIEGSSEAPKNWLAMIDEQFAKETVTVEDFSAWYKKKYDNVTDYMERKKRRIEQKEKKTKSQLDSMS